MSAFFQLILWHDLQWKKRLNSLPQCTHSFGSNHQWNGFFVGAVCLFALILLLLSCSCSILILPVVKPSQRPLGSGHEDLQPGHIITPELTSSVQRQFSHSISLEIVSIATYVPFIMNFAVGYVRLAVLLFLERNCSALKNLFYN